MINSIKELNEALAEMERLAEYDLDAPEGTKFLSLVHDINQYNGTQISALRFKQQALSKNISVPVELSLRDVNIIIDALKLHYKRIPLENTYLHDDTAELLQYFYSARREYNV